VIYSGADAQIELTVSGGTPAYAYHWENSDLQTLSDEASINNLKTGLYYVTVSDFYGCAVSKFFDIEIPFVIPTLMTPNADGLNDTWGIGNIEQFENISIEIYNRWGNIIFKYEGKGSAYADVSNQFDGTFNGKELPLGSYVYILDLKQGNEPVHQGTLSIVRTK
jgi:gliding motility-associated-like protein